ncbi:hypothetical protein D9619_011584 [Psilocybe cf. subviscida]|uniref:Acyltransferase MbtK/IucB-like conserved domain-containing protein n=1 Tax=Psilocybe cf. subviscida TaxID=2480587 RepID=A0A8H5BSG8_9AGAR|nr:hypothetical protein D9619_011584 [Psilocybe cf. subviscida]
MSSSATQRLQAVVDHTVSLAQDAVPKGAEYLLLVLPDGGKVTTFLATTPDGSHRISLNDAPIATYTISENQKLALDVSSVNSRYQGATDHLPRYPLITLSAPQTHPTRPTELSIANFWVAIYALFTLYNTQENIPFAFASVPNQAELKTYLITTGLAQHLPPFPAGSNNEKQKHLAHIVFMSRSTFWQGAGTTGYHSRSWNLVPQPPFPSVSSFTRSEKVIAMHPLRPQKPAPGTILYRRWCCTVRQNIEITYFDVDGVADGSRIGGGVSRHMAAFHRWHNDERVNSAWGERGSLETHREYVESLLVDAHAWPCMLSWDGELMGYVEIVFAKEDHVAQYYPAGVVPGDWERGIHVLAGESRFVGAGRSELWVRSLLHYIFLADPRTDRVVGEPSVTNIGIAKVAVNSGFHFETVFDFPYKRSNLIFNPRDRFFRRCKLW